jgi:hypothetical protein
MLQNGMFLSSSQAFILSFFGLAVSGLSVWMVRYEELLTRMEFGGKIDISIICKQWA